MITASTILTFSVEDLHIHARLIAPDRVRFDWEGNFSMQNPPEGLLEFLLGASEKNREKIENIDMHFEHLKEIRSGMISALLGILMKLKDDRRTVTLCYTLHENFQVTLFSALRSRLGQRIKQFEFHEVAA